MGKNFKLTPQGHRVMGALATFLVPKMAADQSLQSVELEAVCKSISPGRYDKQIEGIIGTVKERFGARFAADENLGDLRKILASLMPADLALDKAREEMAEDSDDDSNDDANDEMESADSFADFIKSKKKAKDKKACDADKEDDKADDEEDDEEDDEDSGGEEEGKGEGGDKKPAKDKANKNANDPKLKNKLGDMDKSDEGQWVKPHKEGSVDKKAKDSALDSALLRDEAADLAIRRIQARYEAAEVVKPIVGKVNVFACDSAADIYKMALDAKGIDTTGFPRSSYGAVLKAVLKSEVKPKAQFAQDKAITKSLLDEFPNLPGLA